MSKGTRHQSEAARSLGDPLLLADAEFNSLRSLIVRETGVFLSDARRELVTARLSKRLGQLHMTSFMQYYELVTRHDEAGQELMTLLNCLTRD